MITLHTLCSDLQLPVSLIYNPLHTVQKLVPKPRGSNFLAEMPPPPFTLYREVAIFFIDFFSEHVIYSISLVSMAISGIYNHLSLFLLLFLL